MTPRAPQSRHLGRRYWAAPCTTGATTLRVGQSETTARSRTCPCTLRHADSCSGPPSRDHQRSMGRRKARCPSVAERSPARHQGGQRRPYYNGFSQFRPAIVRAQAHDFGRDAPMGESLYVWIKEGLFDRTDVHVDCAAPTPGRPVLHVEGLSGSSRTRRHRNDAREVAGELSTPPRRPARDVRARAPNASGQGSVSSLRPAAGQTSTAAACRNRPASKWRSLWLWCLTAMRCGWQPRAF